MLKRLSLALAGLFAFVSVANGAGTVPGFSLTPQFDLSGNPAPGCRLYIIQAGTVATPQNAYSDSGLTQLLPNPMTCDASARLGQFFVADGLIKLRLTTSAGNQIFVGDNLLVIGPSSGGGGGGGSVDPTTIFQTGAFMQFYGTGTLTGWVRCNGKTIGSATSGGTERANADVQALFQYLWGADSNLSVSGGRGASAAADWSANKTITLPDCRGRVFASLPDMGNTAASWLTSTYFGTTLALGAVSTQTDHVTLSASNIPTITSTNAAQAITVYPGGVSTRNVASLDSPSSWALGSRSTTGGGQATADPTSGSGLHNEQTFSANNSISVTSTGTSSTPFPSLQPTILVTTYLKL